MRFHRLLPHGPIARPAAARHMLAAVLTAALLCTGFAVATPAASATSSGGTMTMAPDTYEKRVQRHINRVRANRGLPHLRLERCTDRVAERWSRHLASTGRFQHRSMAHVLRRCDAAYAGETLGRGTISPWRLVRMWLQSPGHRRILLSPKPRRIGVGTVKDAHGRWVTTANFTRF